MMYVNQNTDHVVEFLPFGFRVSLFANLCRLKEIIKVIALLVS